MEEYKDFSEGNVPTDDARDWRNVLGIMQYYMETRGPGQVPYEEVVSVEQGYAMPLVQTPEHEIWYYARPDRVVRRDGLLHTFDTKTTGWLDKNWAKQWQVSVQVTGQMMTVGTCLGEHVGGAFIDGIELRSMNTSTRKCAKHGVPYCECAKQHINFQHVLVDRSQVLRDAWLAETRSAVDAMVKRNEAVAKHGMLMADQRGIYNGTCTAYGGFCQYWDWCQLGRPEDMLESMFSVGTFEVRTQGKILGPGGVVVEFDGGL